MNADVITVRKFEDTFIGKTVDDLDRWTREADNKKVRDCFLIPNATTAQVIQLRHLFNAMAEYDRDYSPDKMPYVVTRLHISQIGSSITEEEKKSQRQIFGRVISRYQPVIQISITTEPVTENTFIQMVDTKDRAALIGSRGGFYTYNDNHHRKQLRDFDVKYGTRRNL